MKPLPTAVHSPFQLLRHGLQVRQGVCLAQQRYSSGITTTHGHAAVARAEDSLPTPIEPSSAPLSVLPLSSLLRSYGITALSSSPLLLQASTRLLQRMLRSRSVWTDVDKNLLLRWLLRKTFYAQFCAGEHKHEVQKSLDNLRKMGYHGAIVEYALEVLEDETGDVPSAAQIADNIATWRHGLLETIDVVNPGDFVGLKWSGMGSEAHRLLKQNASPSPAMANAMTDICDAAAAKNVLLLPAAEPQNANAAVDRWTLDLARRYNTSGHAIVYNTYQCYLKSTPTTLANHLADAHSHDYTLGVKLVRGAYMATEPRHLIWDTLEQTHEAYDQMAEALLQGKTNDMLKANTNTFTFPNVNIVLATHNDASVRKARKIRDAQVQRGDTQLVKLAYAQLQGMADEVSCKLVHAAATAQQTSAVSNQAVDVPRAFKCVTWGSMHDCLNYLLRRAAENKDALARTHETRKALGHELWRRLTFANH